MNIVEAFNKLDNEKFVLNFYQELQKIFGKLSPFLWDLEWNIEETSGWNAAFFKACKENNLLDVYDFGDSLNWIECGRFCGEVNEIFVNYKLAWPESTESFLERKYHLSEGSIVQCWECGQYCTKEDGYFDEFNDFHCNDCFVHKKYTYSMEELGLNIPDYNLQPEEKRMEYYKNILKEIELYKEKK